jgi:hypothetical protein
MVSGISFVVVMSHSLHISTYSTKFISEPVLDGLLGCCTLGYCFLFLFLTVSVLDRGSSAWLFSLLETLMAVVTTTGLVCDPCSLSWFHHMLKCLSLESMTCDIFGFVYSCLTALRALHGCLLWHCCSFPFLFHCTVLCLQWEHHSETSFSRSGSCSLSLSMVSTCSLWCVPLLLLCVSAAHSHTPAHELYPTQLCLHRTSQQI